MAPEASREETEHGTVFKADGWYVLNARDARWYHVDGRGAHCDFEGDAEFSQLGMNIMVLGPGREPGARSLGGRGRTRSVEPSPNICSHEEP